MSNRCELMLFEHAAPCADPDHRKALERRAAGAAKWGQISRNYTGGGDVRDYLHGRPIHCGDMLVVQAVKWDCDDYGEFILYLNTGERVRYELSVVKNPMLYGDLAGHTFTARVEDYMRFRWPQ